MRTFFFVVCHISRFYPPPSEYVSLMDIPHMAHATSVDPQLYYSHLDLHFYYSENELFFSFIYFASR